MKKMIGMTILIMSLFGMLLTGCASTKLSEDFDEATVKSAAEEIVTLLNNNDVETICNEKIDSELSEYFTTDTLQQAIDQYLSDAGAFKEYSKEAVIGTKAQNTKEDCAVAIVKAKYENKSITYTISFNKDMEVIGLYMK